MKVQAEKSPDIHHQAAVHGATLQQDRSDAELQFIDNREETTGLRQLQEAADNSSRSAAMQNLQVMVDNSPRQLVQRQQYSRVLGVPVGLQAGSGDVTVQRIEEEVLLQGEFDSEFPAQLAQQSDVKPNKTGLSDNFKTGVEFMPGLSQDSEAVVIGGRAVVQQASESVESEPNSLKNVDLIVDDCVQRVVEVVNKPKKKPAVTEVYDGPERFSALVRELGGRGLKLAETDQEYRLLLMIIRSENNYHFASFSELIHALRAQTLLNKLEDELGDDHDSTLKEIKKGSGDRHADALASAFTFSQKHNLLFLVRPDDVRTWGGNELISQSLQQRGDMVHVLPALALGNLKVALCWENSAEMTSDAFQITEYYLPMRQHVCLYAGNMQDIAAPNSLTHSTGVLKASAMADPMGTRRAIKEITTGKMTEDDCAKYDQWCSDLGFKRGSKNKYVLVSHRDSGHNVPQGRQASHPELDTGEDGLAQMLAAVGKAGFIPVPMGEPADDRLTSMKPHMIKYWTMGSKYKFTGRTRRQVEYGLIRYLAEEFGVRLLAMRSGNTDAMAFAGMETIFLDLASEGADQSALDKAELGTEAHNRSWRRAALLETILPGIFHQVFFENPRPEENSNGPWRGRFRMRDPLQIYLAINQFFKSSETGIELVTERAMKSPLRPERRDAFASARDDRMLVERRGPRYESFTDFAIAIEADHDQLIRSVPQTLNGIDIVLDRMNSSLTGIEADIHGDSPDIEALQLELDQLQLALDKLKKKLADVIIEIGY